MINCAKCSRPTHLAIDIRKDGKRLCTDCALEALELGLKEVPSFKAFIGKWCESNYEQANGRMNRK